MVSDLSKVADFTWSSVLYHVSARFTKFFKQLYPKNLKMVYFFRRATLHKKMKKPLMENFLFCAVEELNVDPYETNIPSLYPMKTLEFF